MTLNGWFLMRMFLPTGFSVPNRFSATVAPMTATRVRFVMSSLLMNEPLSTVSERICMSSGVTPVTDVFQFWLPLTTWYEELTVGDT